ncbi:hypothetical protein R3P38DRAFT_3200671 [Favolaschia claudopus]|uniref:Bacteriophage T5 Orf172 DNA-binding domain-containing protein n=1 Tax=Favolaschia claudopus TaxID=2862362 RepID=A0AAW0AZN4_9AGAR
MPNYSRPDDPRYPQRPPLPEPERLRERDDLARLPPEVRSDYMMTRNLYDDYDGYIYCHRRWVFDPATGFFYPQIKYGLTRDLQRRMNGYKKCGNITWLFCWPTRCVKLTEAVVHARLRSRGLGADSIMCWCGHSHREYFWGYGIDDVCKEVEEVLFDTAQTITRYIFV